MENNTETGTSARPSSPVESHNGRDSSENLGMNAEAEMAFRFVAETNLHVYLTGRAGTGKTTFLHKLREKLHKSAIVVAPTGVAAINARGATIHSQLQLPFGLLTAERMQSPEGFRLSKKKEQVLQRIDLLIIDEVSMVRADVMDAIDIVLRRVRRSNRAFGGVQLLLIGDLHQLPPVVKDQESAALAQLYSSPYFFSAKALQNSGMVTVELEKVYRQSDAEFVDLLGEVRANRMGEQVLRKLNERYIDAASPDDLDGYITLTTHRNSADLINAEHLRNLDSPTKTFHAKVTGKFPEGNYPTDDALELKVGAQVMFVKNDRDGAYHNGKIGTLVKLDDTNVTVDCGADGGEISVGMVRWENAQYSLDATTKEVNAEVAGSFEQIPLRLAWAITIHKSQGLTFDRVVIDAAAAFAHGQVYVALSRCRSFEGIILRNRIPESAVRTDRQVNAYSQEQRRLKPGLDQLEAARRAYRAQLLKDCFDFNRIGVGAQALRRQAILNIRSFPGLTEVELDEVYNQIQDQVVTVAQRFGSQLETCLQEADLSADPVLVPDRCQKAGSYFIERLEEIEQKRLGQLDLSTDNQEVEQRTQELLKELLDPLAISLAMLKFISTGHFDPNSFVAFRAKKSLDSAAPPKTTLAKPAAVKVVHPLLYSMLNDWRMGLAAREEVPVAQILSSKSMRALCTNLPSSMKALSNVQGIGSITIKRYGKEIIEIIERYQSSGLAQASKGLEVRPSGKTGDKEQSIGPTVALTLTHFKLGKSIDEIVAERGYQANTILGHLAQAVVAGLTDAEGLVTPSDEERLSTYFEANEGEAAGAFAHFDGNIDHGIIKLSHARWRSAKRQL